MGGARQRAVWLGLFFVAGLHFFWVIGFGGLGLAGVAAAYRFLPHVRERIERFMDKSSGDSFQVTPNQVETAVANLPADLREALDAFVKVTQRNVNGESRIKLYRGNATLVGRRADQSLYNPDIASFTMSETYNQADAEGFIKLFGLPMKVRALVEGK